MFSAEVTLKLDDDFVRYWSKLYEAEELGGLERELLTTTHLAITERGYLTVDELMKVARWKARRVLGILTRDEKDVRDVTRMALASETPERFRHHILRILSGVGHPMASAILTIWDPETHTVVDYRVVEALRELEEREALPSAPAAGNRRHMPGYWTYLVPYRDIAKSAGVSHRDLDRALWKWSQAGMPWSWPSGQDSDGTAG